MPENNPYNICINVSNIFFQTFRERTPQKEEGQNAGRDPEAERTDKHKVTTTIDN